MSDRKGYSNDLLDFFDDANRDICCICLQKQNSASTSSTDDITYCCDNCPRVFHIQCIRDKELKPDAATPWFCPLCRYNSDPQLDYHSFLKHCLDSYLSSGEVEKQSELELFGNDGIAAVYKNYFLLFELSTDRLPSIGMLALHFELFVDSACLDSVSSIYCQYFHKREISSNTSYFLSHNPTLEDNIYHEFVFLLRECIGKSIGLEFFDDQFTRLTLGILSPLSLSLRPAISMFFTHCPNQSCREYRYFHRFCYKCGHLYNSVDTYKMAESLKWKLRHKRRNSSKSLNSLKHEKSIENCTIGSNNGNMESDFDGNKDDDEFIFDMFDCSESIPKDIMALLTDTPTEMAMLRGLRYLQTVHCRPESQQKRSEEHSHATYTVGGDILFLLRNIRRGSSGVVQVYSERIMIEWCLKWTDFTTNIGHENIHDTVAGLYVLHEVLAETDGQVCDTVDEKENLYDSSFKLLEQHIDRSMNTKLTQSDAVAPTQNLGTIIRKRARNGVEDIDCDFAKEKSQGPARPTHTYTIASSSSSSLVVPSRRNSSDEFFSSTIPESGRKLTRFRSQMGSNETETLRQHLTRRYESIRSEVLKAMTQEGFDIFSLEPHALGLHPPLTGIDYCGNCSTDNEERNRRSGRHSKAHFLMEEALKPPESRRERPSCGSNNILVKCDQCDRMIVQNINYSSYSDHLLWLSFFQELDLDCSTFLAGSISDNIMSMLRILPLMRSYQSLDSVGENTFIHQCYFATHLIYFFSDYGSHPLTRELFAEEFLFILDSIPVAMQRLDDPELVGEFLHCLSILQYREAADPSLVEIVSTASQYLLRTESNKGCRGMWYTKSDMYRQYHASFCAIMGLLEIQYSLDESRRTSPPVPKILSVLMS